MALFQPSRVLIFGATGTIGRYITNQIVSAQPSFQKVTIFTSNDTIIRKGDYINELKSKGVETITGDINNDDDIKNAYVGSDTVISAVGRNVIDSQMNLIKLAEESSSVKWFFPSEYGTDIEYGPKSVDEKPHQQKLKVRKYIKDHVSRLKYTYVVTGPYPEMFFSSRPLIPESGGYSVEEKKAFLVDNGQGKIGFTTMPDVGKAVVAALQNPESSINKAVKVQSFVVTPKDIQAEFEKQTGGEPWSAHNSTLQELKDTEQKAWEEGQPDATALTLRRIWSEGGTLYEKTDNEAIKLTGSKLETLADAVKRVLTTGY